MPLRLNVTADIPDSIQRDLMSAWDEIEGLEPGNVSRFKSTDGPSFVQIVGEAVQWGTTLKLAAGVFLARFADQLAKESATDVYKHKEQLARAIAAAGAAPVRLAAASLKRIRDRSAGSRVFLGLSRPDDYFGGSVDITDRQSSDEIAYVLAAFVVKAEAIQSAIESEVQAGRGPLAAVQVIPTDGGGFTLVWIDKTFVERRLEIP